MKALRQKIRERRHSALKSSLEEPPPVIPALEVPNVSIEGLDFSKFTLSEPPEPQGRKFLLPVEVWEEIFHFATVITGKDEFSTEGEAYYSMICDPRPVTTAFTTEDHSWAIKTRRSIIMVCKKWYRIGLPLLWSNFRIRSMTSGDNLQSIKAALISYPELASVITRVEIFSPSEELPRTNYEAAKTIDAIPFVKVLVCSLQAQRFIGNDKAEILTLFRDQLGQNHYTFSRFLWQNVHILVISCLSSDYTGSNSAKISFPRLKYLYVRTNNDFLAVYIIEHWNIPSLLVLSIENPPIGGANWANFLIRCGATLEKLELKVSCYFITPWTQKLSMPRLRTLYVGYRFDSWFELIQAPRLHRIGFFGTIRQPWSLQHGSVLNLFNLFPTVRELSIRGVERSVLTEPGTLFDHRVDEWKRRGVQTDFTWNEVNS